MAGQPRPVAVPCELRVASPSVYEWLGLGPPFGAALASVLALCTGPPSCRRTVALARCGARRSSAFRRRRPGLFRSGLTGMLQKRLEHSISAISRPISRRRAAKINWPIISTHESQLSIFCPRPLTHGDRCCCDLSRVSCHVSFWRLEFMDGLGVGILRRWQSSVGRCRVCAPAAARATAPGAARDFSWKKCFFPFFYICTNGDDCPAVRT